MDSQCECVCHKFNHQSSSCPICKCDFFNVKSNGSLTEALNLEVDSIRVSNATLYHYLHEHEKRLSKVESYLEVSDSPGMNSDLLKIDKLDERLEQLEKWSAILEERVHDELNKLEIAIEQTRIQFINQIGNNEEPYKCPLCFGIGTILSLNNELKPGEREIRFTDALGRLFSQCHICKGKGIVWK